MASVAALHPEILFLPVETASEGEVNALSRVQMALGDARRRARLEFRHALDESGCTVDRVRQYVMSRPELRRPFYRWPHREGIAGTAAQFVLHAGDLMRKDS
jgi:hypothetical protein